MSIDKNGRIIRFQWMNQTTKRKAPSGRAVLTRTTWKDKHLKCRPISEMRNALKLNQHSRHTTLNKLWNNVVFLRWINVDFELDMEVETTLKFQRYFSTLIKRWKMVVFMLNLGWILRYDSLLPHRALFLHLVSFSKPY